MTTSKSMPSPAPSSLPSPQDRDSSRLMDKAELIDRLATEMRVASGGELPHSFCIAQVKRQLAGKSAEASPANGQAPPATKAAAAGRSVFHAWAMPE